MTHNIAVIIPVHKYDDVVKMYLTQAINSVPTDVDVFISCPNNISGLISVDVEERVNMFDEGTESSFQALVNSAVNKLNGYEWFSILEYDDTYTSYWFDEVDNYITHYPSTSMFLPLTDLKNPQMKFSGYGNEAPLASAFSNELGFIDFEVLENYFDFYLTGSVININDFKTAGGLKTSIKLTFWYEFLLRLTSKEKKVMVIPKIGYNHLIGRADSLSSELRETMDQEESEWWYNLAKEEYKHTKDRNKTYKGKEEK